MIVLVLLRSPREAPQSPVRGRWDLEAGMLNYAKVSLKDPSGDEVHFPSAEFCMPQQG